MTRINGAGEAMRVFVLLAVIAISASERLPAASSPRAPAPVQLFDGRSFTGWEGNRGIFRIEGGAVIGGSLHNRIAQNEFLSTTKSYSDFELRLEIKLLGGDSANAGVQFRTRRIPNNNEVIGYQADAGQGHWGALYDETRRKKTLKAPDAARLKGLVRAGDWNSYVIRAEGRRIRLWLNGVQTVDYTEQDQSVSASGVIALQIHAGPPSEAWYKDITLLDLTPK
jgi:3-keto-disaccharide hydrolase